MFSTACSEINLIQFINQRLGSTRGKYGLFDLSLCSGRERCRGSSILIPKNIDRFNRFQKISKSFRKDSKDSINFRGDCFLDSNRLRCVSVGNKPGRLWIYFKSPRPSRNILESIWILFGKFRNLSLLLLIVGWQYGNCIKIMYRVCKYFKVNSQTMGKL